MDAIALSSPGVAPFEPAFEDVPYEDVRQVRLRETEGSKGQFSFHGSVEFLFSSDNGSGWPRIFNARSQGHLSIGRMVIGILDSLLSMETSGLLSENPTNDGQQSQSFVESRYE